MIDIYYEHRQNLMPQMTNGGGIKNKGTEVMEQHRLRIY